MVFNATLTIFQLYRGDQFYSFIPLYRDCYEISNTNQTIEYINYNMSIRSFIYNSSSL